MKTGDFAAGFHTESEVRWDETSKVFAVVVGEIRVDKQIRPIDVGLG